MYDEHIQLAEQAFGIKEPIKIEQPLTEIIKKNFNKRQPKNVILTGTAGDGKTYYCRQLWKELGGKSEDWTDNNKHIKSISLPAAKKKITIVKDLSELNPREKKKLLKDLTAAVKNRSSNEVFLVAANDGQLLTSWRDWSKDHEEDHTFNLVETMLVDEQEEHKSLQLLLVNLSRQDAAEHFRKVVEAIVEHPQWQECADCQILEDENEPPTCAIRINRQKLRDNADGTQPVFLQRLCDLLTISRANRMHSTIRDLLLLTVNIILGVQNTRTQAPLLDCNTAKDHDYKATNPYANVFGRNLPNAQREQYHLFTTLEAFNIGYETDNAFDNALIFSPDDDPDFPTDDHYGASTYEELQKKYTDEENLTLEDRTDFLEALAVQRQRLFFSLPQSSNLNCWHLTVSQEAGRFLEFVKGLKEKKDVSQTEELLIQGLNRTFCGMMIEDGTMLWLASSGGDGRGKIATIKELSLQATKHAHFPYVCFTLPENEFVPKLQIRDPADDAALDHVTLQPTHFEYLIRIAQGSLPASFSRQYYEEFLDCKLRFIEKLDKFKNSSNDPEKISLEVLEVDPKRGKITSRDLKMRLQS